MRNILSSVPKKGSKPFREAVKAIFKFSDIHLARKAKNALIEEYSDQTKYKKIVEHWMKALKMLFNIQL